MPAADEFLTWCADADVPTIGAVQPVHVATWIEAARANTKIRLIKPRNGIATRTVRRLTMPPIEMLRAAGVLVFAGNDDIRDTWYPYGTGDLLERAAIIGWKGDLRRDAQCTESLN
jgi:hypothetical protein